MMPGTHMMNDGVGDDGDDRHHDLFVDLEDEDQKGFRVNIKHSARSISGTF